MVKFIKDLTEKEKETYFSSGLYREVTADFYFLPKAMDYNYHYFGEAYKDLSMVVFIEKKPVVALYAATNNEQLSFYSFPATVFSDPAYPDYVNTGFKELFAKIAETAAQAGINSFRFFDNPYLNAKYFSKIQSMKIHHYGMIDLNLSEESIKSNLRTSNKTQINWGAKNLEIKVYDQSNPDKAVFDSFREFHIKVAGRQTRSNESWDLQFEMLKNGQAFLVAAYWNSQLVCGTLILHGWQTGYYGVTVNDRDLMREKIPVGYYPILAAMYHAKKIGLKKFHMNKVDRDSDDPKLRNLADFKEGFTKTLETRIVYTVNL